MSLIEESEFTLNGQLKCMKVMKGFTVDMETFRMNRRRLIQKVPNEFSSALIVLKGGQEVPHYDTDTVHDFRQESFFLWTFGVQEPGFWGAIDVKDGSSYLFAPHFPQSYRVWMGDFLSLDDIKKKYGVDHVRLVKHMNEVFSNVKPTEILLLSGTNTDSGLTSEAPTIEFDTNIKINTEALHPIMSALRVIKTPLELDLLRHVNHISSFAHRMVMRRIKGQNFEYQAEALFKFFALYVGGARTVSYTCICGSGHNSSILHYGHAAAPNNKIIQANDMCLFDMGASFFGYASDITCSFPVSGKFTHNQAIVYTAVLNARDAVIAKLKPGVSWIEMHKLAALTILQELTKNNILKGDCNTMLEDGLSGIFFPHGLGHLMGIDVHDVGGYMEGTPSRPTEPFMKSLRTARILQAGMVLTVEPGCYFIPSLLDQAKADPKLKEYLVLDRLKSFEGFGGVRIEDDICITEDGCENMTDVPRTINEIEAWMNSDSSINPFDDVVKRISLKSS